LLFLLFAEGQKKIHYPTHFPRAKRALPEKPRGEREKIW